jgi:hypothetical protein
MSPGDIRRWRLPFAEPAEHFLVLDVKTVPRGDGETSVTFLTDGIISYDDADYIKSISEAVNEVG